MGATIIVPAYQAAEDLTRCLASLERTLPAGTRVFVADDASPDRAVAQVIATQAASSRLARVGPTSVSATVMTLAPSSSSACLRSSAMAGSW